MEIRPLRSLCYELFSFFTMEFWLPWSPSHELFSFFTIGFRLPQSLSHEYFSFFTMGFWLSQSLSHELFFSFFTMGFRLSQSLSHEFFLFSRWDSGYHKAFLTNFFLFSRWDLFSRLNFGNTQFGGRLFLYIYHKEYLHRIRLVKNLASWFRAPFARKRVRSFLF
jgi:hypothetical protein